MTNKLAGRIECDLEKYVVYENSTAETLLALPIAEKQRIKNLSYNYDRLENVPDNIEMDFYLLRFDPKDKIHFLTDEKRTFPINQLSPIFINLLRN